MAFWNKNKSGQDNQTKEQSEEEKALVSKIRKMYRDAYNAKAPFHALWEKCYKAYTGELFNLNLPEYRSQVNCNYVFSTVETIKPVMVANNPKILVFPQSEEFTQKANRVQRAMDYEWNRAKMFTKLVQAETIGLIYGTVLFFVPWDNSSDNGLGNCNPIALSPWNIFPDPMATCVNDMEYFAYVTYKNVGELIKMYPNKRLEIMKAAEKPTDKYIAFGKELSNANSDTSVECIEMYFRDYSLELEIEDAEDGNKYQISKPKYPNGRKVVVAGDYLLDDIPLPYQDGRFPLVAWKCYDIPGQFWGMGEVEQIISAQRAKMDVTNKILDSARLMANPVWIVDKNSGVEKNSLTSRDGLVVRKNPGTEVKRDAPPPLPAYIQNIIEVFNRDIEHISGVYDVTRGERPTGITAAAAIQALNEQAQGRIKLKVQALEQMLSELGSMWLSRIQQFWDSKRNIRVMNMDYKVAYDVIDKSDIDGDFDVIIAAGSTMAVNKTARLQQLIQMAQTQAEDGMPLVDRQTVLENSDLPNLEEVLQRFGAIKQQQAQEQQAQQQAQMQQQLMMEQQKNQASEQQAEQQASREMDKSEIAHMQELEKMALQQQGQAVQSESEEQNGEQEALMQIIEMLGQMQPDQIRELAEKVPEVAQLLQMLSQQTEQSQ